MSQAPAGDVGAARLDEDAPIRWPSPGTLFASATRRASGHRRRRVVGRPAVGGRARTRRAALGPPAPRRAAAVASTATGDATATRHTRRATTGHVVPLGSPVPARRHTSSRAPARDVRVRLSQRRAIGRRHTRSDVACPTSRTVSPPIVRTAAPSREHVAARFLTELSHGERRQPQPLPAPYRPMAEAITGHHRVLISTDDASRRALRAVNKVAATTGDVIHLAAPPVVGPRHTEVMAHELTHVAHPSPAPRFFADDDRGPEERRADEIARVIARSPLGADGLDRTAGGDRPRRSVDGDTRRGRRR